MITMMTTVNDSRCFMQLHERQREILTHALGLKKKTIPNRNLYVGISGGCDTDHIQNLLDCGLIEFSSKNEEHQHNAAFVSLYVVTDLGKETILDIIKKKRK